MTLSDTLDRTDRPFRFSRRTLLAGVPGLLLLAAGVACGGDDDDDDDAAQPTTSSAATATSSTGAEPTQTTASALEPTETTATEASPATDATTTGTQSGAADGAWSFTDDRGITIDLPKRPERIVAQTTAAAALWDFGVRPVAIFGPSRTPDGEPDFQTGSIDLDAVEVLGDYGEMDLEQLVALNADLYIDMTYSGGTLWYLDEELKSQVEAIVPTLGISMEKVSIIESIGRFGELAAALGADPDLPEVVEARADFADAEAELKAAIEDNPGLTVLVTSPGIDQLYIASPDWMVDLHYFRDLGLDIVAHTTDNFFELISWEQANKYPADLILTDERTPPADMEQIAEFETWASLPAVQAGQVGPWYAGAPYSYQRLIPIMEELTELIRGSRADIV